MSRRVDGGYIPLPLDDGTKTSIAPRPYCVNRLWSRRRGNARQQTVLWAANSVLRTGAETDGELLSIECFTPATAWMSLSTPIPRQDSRAQVISGARRFRVRGVEATTG